MPTQIVFGNGNIASLSQYVQGRNACLLTTSGFKSRGTVDEMLEILRDNQVNVVATVPSHPTFSDINDIYNKVWGESIDVIIALGGGSVIDVAKFVSIYDKDGNPDYELVNQLTRNRRNEGYKSVPIISIPTTAGTSSEITPWATIWDDVEKRKYSLHLPELFSKVAIYDPQLTLSLSRELTVQTGLDALSHALESIWNKNANPVTLQYAITAAKLVYENLLQLVSNLDDLSLREKMMLASMYAGMAFSNTQTALAHAMSYYITLHHDVSHGIACSFTLPILIDKVCNQYEYIDDSLQEIFGEVSSRPLRILLKELGVDTDFSAYGIDSKEYGALIESLKKTQRASNSLVSV